MWRCKDKHCAVGGIHETWASFVSDTNGFLFIAVAEPEEGEPGGMLLTQQSVLRVEFPSLTFDAPGEGITWERQLKVLSQEEIEAAKLEPEMFE